MRGLEINLEAPPALGLFCRVCPPRLQAGEENAHCRSTDMPVVFSISTAEISESLRGRSIGYPCSPWTLVRISFQEGVRYSMS